MKTFSQTSGKPQTVVLRQSSQINQKFVLACTALFQIEIFALLRSFRSFVANQFPFTDLISHLALTTTRPLAATLMQMSKSLPVITRRRSCVIDRHGLTRDVPWFCGHDILCMQRVPALVLFEGVVAAGHLQKVDFGSSC
jgi:hypothetical protein